jgi:hypothetical protein
MCSTQQLTLIEWDVHITKSLEAYDMIIGRDLLKFLGIDVKFSNMTVEWGNASMPFKEYDSPACVKEILEAKQYVPADLEKICSNCIHLQIEQQKKLLDLLQKYKDLFDGSLGKWNATEVNIELNEGATPYHAKAYPIPKCHLETLQYTATHHSGSTQDWELSHGQTSIPKCHLHPFQ